jgi:hypothetical protein
VTALQARRGSPPGRAGSVRPRPGPSPRTPPGGRTAVPLTQPDEPALPPPRHVRRSRAARTPPSRNGKPIFTSPPGRSGGNRSYRRTPAHAPSPVEPRAGATTAAPCAGRASVTAPRAAPTGPPQAGGKRRGPFALRARSFCSGAEFTRPAVVFRLFGGMVRPSATALCSKRVIASNHAVTRTTEAR